MVRDDVFKVSGTTAEQRARWRVAAGGGTRDLSAWIRAAADTAASYPGPAPAIVAEALRADLVALRADLARGVGNNLNQLAAHLNAAAKGGAANMPAEAALATAAADVAAMRAALTEALAVLRPARRR